MPRPSETPRDRAYFRRLGDQRASTADRDTVIELLSRHCTDGRLTMDEFEERVAEATAARTGNELAEALRELPADGDGWTASDFATEEGSDERWYERARARETWGRRGGAAAPARGSSSPSSSSGSWPSPAATSASCSRPSGSCSASGSSTAVAGTTAWPAAVAGARTGTTTRHGDAPPWDGRRGAAPRRDVRDDWAGSRTIDV